MKQYCRYCAYCNEYNTYVCTEGPICRHMTESQIKHTNNCKNYADCGIDVITGKERRARPARENLKTADNGSVQVSMFEEVSE